MDAALRGSCRAALAAAAPPSCRRSSPASGGSEGQRRSYGCTEDGGLAELLAGSRPRDPRFCAPLRGARFVLCGSCDGGRKVFDEEEDRRRRCPDCNENGLVRCPHC
ncbi:unnamed protein product [Spirodela intermedia]|uniref:Uncharacterized protein n=1 Tax=Spirodela intermedia TaxID=51605 RepID=A0A7I8JGC0_SPIIN|nr:unnamed protein product [Spirodela intermedia]CAA6669001.1 unnamed protein product [Spirodela intermedia]